MTATPPPWNALYTEFALTLVAQKTCAASLFDRASGKRPRTAADGVVSTGLGTRQVLRTLGSDPFSEASNSYSEILGAGGWGGEGEGFYP